MRMSIILPFVLMSVALPSSGAAQDDEWVVESRAAAGDLGAALMGELTRALAESPVAAIEVCSRRAGEIAARVSATTGAEVGRTAARYRNPDNAPTEWQQRGLDYFGAGLASGANPASLEFTETAVVDGRTIRRWMRPIMTAPLCLTCHGTDLQTEVAAVISERYPQDRATGFAAGDLRGAFHVSWVEARPE